MGSDIPKEPANRDGVSRPILRAPKRTPRLDRIQESIEKARRDTILPNGAIKPKGSNRRVDR